MTSGTATSSGILFGPNNSGKMYISVYNHRGSGSRVYKNQWLSTITPAIEYTIFCDADDGNWKDYNGHYWGVHNRGITVLGDCREHLSKFPKTSNLTDHWHGYPVSPRESGDKDAPPDDFVESWISIGVVSKTFGRRIQRRKI